MLIVIAFDIPIDPELVALYSINLCNWHERIFWGNAQAHREVIYASAKMIMTA